MRPAPAVFAAIAALAATACDYHGRDLGGVAHDGPSADGTTADWWDPAYRYRAPIIVTATPELIAGYSIELAVATDALVTAGQASPTGDDWRVVRQDVDGSWHELDRWIDDGEGTGWNGADTRTWFELPVAVAAGATDAQTYVYFGAPGASAPPASLAGVFLFGDDFEAGLDRWTPNQLGESVRITTEHRAGTSSLEFIADGTGAAGMHRDISLPATTLMFSHYLRQAQTDKSFGDGRGFDVPYAGRQPPAWVDTHLRLPHELDSANALQVWADTTLENYFTPFGAGTWHDVDLVFDVTANTVHPRVDGVWFGPFLTRYPQGTPIESIALEGEGGQAGTFWVDNYVIRPFVDPEPTAVLGAIEMLAP